LPPQNLKAIFALNQWLLHWCTACPGKQFLTLKQMNDEWITIQEVMQFLKFKSKSSVYKFISLHKVRITKALSNTLVSKTDIVKVLEKNTVII
jgi:hypothetical protein